MKKLEKRIGLESTMKNRYVQHCALFAVGVLYNLEAINMF